MRIQATPGVLSREQYDAVIFDMDGVVTDTAHTHAAAWKLTFDAYLASVHTRSGPAPAPFDHSDYLSFVDGKHRDDGVASFLASRDIELPRGTANDPAGTGSIWAIANSKNDAFQTTLARDGATAFPSTVALVRSLQRQGFGTAIISASRNCLQVLEAAGIGDLFAVRVDGLETERLGLAGKPSPAVFVEAARRLGVVPSRAVVVEDAISGVEAGRTGRFALVVGVDRTDNAKALRASGADIVVTDLAELQVQTGWAVVGDGFDVDRLRVDGSLFSLADGRIGTSGAPLAAHPGSQQWVLVGGAYVGSGAETHLVTAPIAMQLPFEMATNPLLSRVLDLRSGVLNERVGTTQGALTSVRFSCLARPGTVAFRAAYPTPRAKGPPLLPPLDDAAIDDGRDGDAMWMRVPTGTGGVVAAAVDQLDGNTIDRIAVYDADPHRLPDPAEALLRLKDASSFGFDALLTEQRAAWAARWSDADVVIHGDDELQEAVRFSLFNLMASVPSDGEAAVGARGLTGTNYRGHVFWDADTFTLPFLAATHAASARAILEYRIRRLPEAMAAARAENRRGARFPWESAETGRDVTPTSAVNRAGEIIPILTGSMEEHVVAQVAWAVGQYVDWTNDRAFADGPGLELLTETARYWASRVERDEAGAHISGVIGPDEYHENIDDNAFTNVMARWNLRRAADAAQVATTTDVGPKEIASWREIANSLVDGFDPATKIYEQFAGFHALEPLIIAEVAPRRPITADLLLGAERVRAGQVLKQADVLMLHHLVPDEVVPGSLEANLAFYEPRTAHGSSLSPGVHASLFARAGNYEAALEWLRVASRIDLDDVTGSSAGGLHLATMGSVWQALAYGFAGLRPTGDTLTIDPHLPPSWRALEIRVCFRGSRIVVRAEHERLRVDTDRPASVTVGSTRYDVELDLSLRRADSGWEVTR